MKKLLTTSMLATANVAFAGKGATAPAPEAPATNGSNRVAPELTAVHVGIPMPKRETKRGSVSIYPFDSLTEIGQCFGVKNKTAGQLSSIVSNQNRKSLTAKLDDAGNTVFKTRELVDPTTGAKTNVPTTEPEMVLTKRFAAFDVTPELAAQIKGTPLDGAKALIYRVPVDAKL